MIVAKSQKAETWEHYFLSINYPFFSKTTCPFTILLNLLILPKSYNNGIL